MKDFIKTRLNEMLGSSAKLPGKINVDESVLNALKNLTWNDIKIDADGDDGHSKIDMDVIFNNPNLNYVSEGIVFYIQLIKEQFYHPHLFLTQSIQGIRLGPKILKSFIMEFGHIYVTEARIVNPDALKMVSSLFSDPDLEVVKGKLGIMVIKKGNPDTKALKKFVI